MQIALREGDLDARFGQLLVDEHIDFAFHLQAVVQVCPGQETEVQRAVAKFYKVGFRVRAFSLLQYAPERFFP